MKKAAFFAFLILTVFTDGPRADSSKTGQTALKVCVLKDAKELILSVKGLYTITALDTGAVLKKGRDLTDAKVLPAPNGLSVAGEPFGGRGVKIAPAGNSSVYVNARPFRGSVDIIRTEGARLIAVNEVETEDYLKGVLYREVSQWWPMETLKAQAIAARTYALYQREVRAGRDYDLTCDVYSQVYGGIFSERIRTNRAVGLTRQKVLTYGGALFPSYYHASCGGRTESASCLWNMNIDIPPLGSVRCGFCGRSPHHRWKCKISFADIEKNLAAAGYAAEGLRIITAEDKTSSGRVKNIRLICKDKETAVPASEFRLAVGPDLVRSTNFTLNVKNKTAFFEGRGWGHGAGMCQWGAFFLGLKRYKAEQILKYYYPQAKINRM